MKITPPLSIALAILAAIISFAVPSVAAEKSEDQLIAELSNKDGKKVATAMLHIEKKYPTSAKALPIIKGFLTDSRPEVRRKAARVLGALHTDVTESELKAITELFKATDPREIMDGLIALRGLKSKSTIPQILPLLNHSTPNVIRDACRTLGEIGSKDVIPAIEPLLNHADAKVKKDAQDAIFKLKNK